MRKPQAFLIGKRAFTVVSIREKILWGVHFLEGLLYCVIFCHRTLSDEEATEEESLLLCALPLSATYTHCCKEGMEEGVRERGRERGRGEGGLGKEGGREEEEGGREKEGEERKEGKTKYQKPSSLDSELQAKLFQRPTILATPYHCFAWG